MKKFLNNPTVPFEINSKITVADILNQMAKTSFQARNLGKAFAIYKKMLSIKTMIFFGLAGAMIPAGMRNVISFLIKNRYLDCIVATGANIFHDIVESLGYHHYIGTNYCDDNELHKHRIDRIYDTFASEDDFIATDNFIADFAFSLPDKTYSTREFLYRLGKYLINAQKKKKLKIDGFIITAAENNVPIYCPSISDSSIGIALTELLYKKNRKIKFDLIKDIEETAFLCAKFKSSSVIYIGGGVPKNFIQQTEVTAPFIGYSVSGHKYAIQITQDSPQWGGLSGCTFDEAQSWGKIACDAKTVTVYADATIILPILVTALAQENIKRKFIPKFELSENLKVS